jgi:hypothetical protein
MRRLSVFPVIVTALLALLALLAAACGSERPQDVTSAAPAKKVVTEKDYDSNRFSDPTRVDNQWFPLKPGMQFTLEGSAIEDERRVTRRVVFTVTDLTKVIDGVRTVVVWDRDWSQGRLVEAELAFFAQDDDGNVWHLGQFPAEYEDGEFVGAPAWFAGLDGAKAGLAMRVEPRVGTSEYSQGLAPKAEYADRAKVHKTLQESCVAAGCYQDVLVTEEWDAADPAARQLKYYARGVGNLRVGWLGRDEEQEVLSLVNLTQLSPQALAAASAEALRLERFAYRTSKGLYGRTAPAERPAPTAPTPTP